MRDRTERLEGIEFGTAKMVGTDKNNIISNVYLLLNDEKEYNNMSKAINPYGDGKASTKIYNYIKENLL
jgi:UDP-N-acetylglucosamine 2-epimerase (non-hydrolysing)